MAKKTGRESSGRLQAAAIPASIGRKQHRKKYHERGESKLMVTIQSPNPRQSGSSARIFLVAQKQTMTAEISASAARIVTTTGRGWLGFRSYNHLTNHPRLRFAGCLTMPSPMFSVVERPKSPLPR